MFDFFWKPKPLSKYPAYLGHTVHQSEYDALKGECDRAHELNVADRAIIQQQAREIEQLTEQLDECKKNTRKAVDDANDLYIAADEAYQKVDKLQAEIDALRQQQIMLTTTTPTNKRKPRTTGAKP